MSLCICIIFLWSFISQWTLRLSSYIGQWTSSPKVNIFTRGFLCTSHMYSASFSCSCLFQTKIIYYMVENQSLKVSSGVCYLQNTHNTYIFCINKEIYWVQKCFITFYFVYYRIIIFLSKYWRLCVQIFPEAKQYLFGCLCVWYMSECMCVCVFVGNTCVC